MYPERERGPQYRGAGSDEPHEAGDEQAGQRAGTDWAKDRAERGGGEGRQYAHMLSGQGQEMSASGIPECRGALLAQVVPDTKQKRLEQGRGPAAAAGDGVENTTTQPEPERLQGRRGLDDRYVGGAGEQRFAAEDIVQLDAAQAQRYQGAAGQSLARAGIDDGAALHGAALTLRAFQGYGIQLIQAVPLRAHSPVAGYAAAYGHGMDKRLRGEGAIQGSYAALRPVRGKERKDKAGCQKKGEDTQTAGEGFAARPGPQRPGWLPGARNDA